MSARPRLLYVSLFYPPSRASGVYRAKTTADLFAESGWDVTVATADEGYFASLAGSTDPSLVPGIDESVRVKRVSPPSSEGSVLASVRAGLGKRADRRFEARFFPEKYWGWARRVLEESLREHSRRPFDLVLATGNPNSAFAVAQQFKERTGTPYLLDFRDSWTLDLFTGKEAHAEDSADGRWERRCVEGAAGISFVNEPIREWYAARYPEAADRMTVVLNGWDEEYLDTEAQAGHGEPGPHTDFAFVGTLTRQHLVKRMGAGLDALRRANPELGARIRLYGYLGYFEDSRAGLMRKLGLDGESGGDPAVEYRGPIPKSEISSVYARSDVLLFLAGGSKYVTSGKVFEYMATGKPVVSIHKKGSDAERFLRDYPLWFKPESLEADDVAAAMRSAADAARSPDPDLTARALDHGVQWSRRRSLRRLVETAETCLVR
ncbi:glycosyltransferase [Salininema proteolyticum]|uniref:Glycosyltransferase n=1 Tax=Salininema proteolyticum TaxID=1607685 RepID=A0ABV8TY66_9ACTN